jgi:sulfate adenylyltransferase (ADP) / ATP adenylyltransferase
MTQSGQSSRVVFGAQFIASSNASEIDCCWRARTLKYAGFDSSDLCPVMPTPTELESSLQFQPGHLWPQIVAISASALASGALHSIPTTYEPVEDQGIPFLVRVLTNLARKDAATPKAPLVSSAPQTANPSSKPFNPFLPPESDLLVAEISTTHRCVLNKFNVVDYHFLLVTREFESQDDALTLADFMALAACLYEFEGLAFYNGGRLAGASQPHKHLQMVPVPFTPYGVPLESVFADAYPQEDGLETISVLPFQHALVRWRSLESSPARAAIQMLDIYQRLLKRLQLLPSPSENAQPDPYNLLVTRNWMFMVPRSQEAFQAIAVNALGFAGALLVRSPDQMDFVKQAGPLKILAGVAKPSPLA